MYSRMRYPLSCFCLFLLATFGFALAGSSGKNLAQGALSAPYTGNGAIRLGGGNWGTLSNTAKYSVLLASSENANLAGAAPGRALMYACGTNTDSSDAGSAPCGVSYSTAVANNWILKDSSGNYIHYRGGPQFSSTSGAPRISRDSSPTSTQTYALIPAWTDFGSTTSSATSSPAPPFRRNIPPTPPTGPR